jgi:hypothetical protein
MKTILRQVFWLVSMTIFLFMTTSCSSAKKAFYSVEDETAREKTGIRSEKGQAIEGYVLRTGQYEEYKGRVALVGTDTLSFWKEDKVIADIDMQATTVKRADAFKLATADVTQLNVKVSSGSVVGWFLLVAFVFVLAAAVTSSGSGSSSSSSSGTSESCPFIFSHDGEAWIFDGEPYGGATMSSLQRTDASELEHLVAVDGAYRLRLGNEMDEAQHTDHLELVTVDHPTGTRVVMDREGAPHCFATEVSLSAASDELGNDLTRWLQEDDLVAWQPDLLYHADQDPLPDTRNHITLEFPRPAGQDQVHLVSSVGTGQWGSHMIRVMLGLRGDRIQEFYDAVNGSVELQHQLEAWNDREELFTLGVELQEGENWVRRGELLGGGPLMKERRAVPLDLSRVQGETVRLRIHPPIGYWSLNSFHLAWDEQSVKPIRPELAMAVNQDGLDVAALLASIDEKTYDMPTNEEWAELVFTAPPPPPPGLERSIFAVSTGWYQIHLYPDGPPDTDRLTRLAFEPGYAVRLAMEDLRSFRETGVLSYTKGAAVSP